MKPTWISRRPSFTSASMILRQASCLGASGFSQKMGLPAASAGRIASSCAGPQEQISTASTSLAAIRRRCVVVDGGAGLLGRRLGAGAVGVGHRDDLAAGEDVGDAADVVLADHAGADDADAEGHLAAPMLVDVALHLVPHEARALLGALLPGEDAGGHDAVEADFGERAEEVVPRDLALADVEVLVHPRGRARAG